MNEERVMAKADTSPPMVGQYSPLRQRAFFTVQESPETVAEWIKQNIHRATPDRLYAALATAIEMRDGK